MFSNQLVLLGPPCQNSTKVPNFDGHNTSCGPDEGGVLMNAKWDMVPQVAEQHLLLS